VTTLRAHPDTVADASPASPASPSALADAGPTRGRMLANFVATQAAWFAAVLGATHGRPDLGIYPALAVVAWHLSTVARPRVEALLVAAVAALGLLAETVVVALGHATFVSGQWHPALPPAWLVALWAVFAVTLNVTLRWLHGRPLLAAALGALAGPVAFASGVRLGAARFVDPAAAIATLVVEWGVMMPLLVALSARLDGVARSRGAMDGTDAEPRP